MRARLVACGIAGLVAGCGRISFDSRADARLVDAIDVDVPITGCMSGMTLAPVGVLNASLSSPNDACDINNVLALDGVVAGLDRSGSPVQCSNLWEPSGSCGCLALDLGAAFPIGQVTVYARAVAKACTYACITTNCGTGDFLAVLAGVAENNYREVVHVPITAVSTAYDVTVNDEARYIVLCRLAYGEERDDIEIDYVSVACR